MKSTNQPQTKLEDSQKANLGDVEILVMGERLTCDWSGCLFWKKENTLIVSDLHLEKGSSFAKKGIMVPPYDTSETLKKLSARITHWDPKRIVSLGDSFHDPMAHERLLQSHLDQIKQLQQGREWVWICGNHDPDAPSNLGGISALEYALGPLVFRHEPLAGNQLGEIAGHLHPVGKIIRRKKGVRRPCFVTDKNRLIMPSFGAFTGGLNIRHRAFNGLFNENGLSAILLGQERVFHISAKNLVG